jgi:hypothetical protein
MPSYGFVSQLGRSNLEWPNIRVFGRKAELQWYPIKATDTYIHLRRYMYVYFMYLVEYKVLDL